MTWLPLTRLIVFGASTVFAIIVLALGAHLIAAGQGIVIDEGFLGSVVENIYFPFTGLAVAVAAIHLVTVTPMLVIGHLRTGAFTSLVLVEVVWLNVMWVLWLAAGGLAANTVELCGTSQFSICSEGEAIAAFSFITWFGLMVYSVTLLVFASIAHSRGQTGVWMSPATDGVESSPPMTEKPMAMAPTSAGTPTTASMSVQRAPAAEV